MTAIVWINFFLPSTADSHETFFQKLIKAGNVTVNGEIIQKNSFPVAMDDLVTVTIPETESVDILPEDTLWIFCMMMRMF